jgi:hypothetical protein
MIFKDKGWSGYGDWLGTGRIANRSKRFRGFETARRFVQSQNLKSNKEWRAFCTSGHLPEDIPSNPDKGYYDNGWMDWGDWLGTGKVASSAIEYRTFA